MRKPDFLCSSVYDIPFSFYEDRGIAFILLDLDNTLASYLDKAPSDKTKRWIKELKGKGIRPIIASNNTSRRVHDFASSLEIEHFSSLRKPFTKRLLKILREKGLKIEEGALIGDQLLTDVQAGKGAGLLTILSDPLVKEDGPWTKINRVLERPFRKRFAKTIARL